MSDTQLFVVNDSPEPLDEVAKLTTENVRLRKMLMNHMRGLLDKDELSLDNPYMVAARAMMAQAELIQKEASNSLETCKNHLDRVEKMQDKLVIKEADAKKKVGQRDKAYEDLASSEKRLKVVSALSDKQARENKDLVAKCAKLERDLAKASKSSRDPSPKATSPKATSPKDAALERERDALLRPAAAGRCRPSRCHPRPHNPTHIR